MAKARISAARISSMLQNRHQNVDDVQQTLSLSVSLSVLTRQDTFLQFADIEALARHFQKPWPYLLIKEQEVMKDKGYENRRSPTKESAKMPSELINELERAHNMLDNAIEFFPSDKISLPLGLKAFSDNAGIQENARITRDFLGITFQDQIEFQDEFVALNGWKTAIHSSGIYVSQRNLAKSGGIRAFCVNKDKYALMVVNTAEIPYARIFSMLHEYCHILMNTAGVCDFNDDFKREKTCNEFAANVLLPRQLVKRKLAKVKLVNNVEKDLDVIKRLSKRLRVSQTFLTLRLSTLGLLSNEYCERLKDTLESKDLPKRQSGGDHYLTKIAHVGDKYALNVFGALSDGRISRSDASNMLDIREHFLSTLQQKLLEKQER